MKAVESSLYTGVVWATPNQGTPPHPTQVSLSGTKWPGMFGLQAVLAFNPLILKGLDGKDRKTKGLEGEK